MFDPLGLELQAAVNTDTQVLQKNRMYVLSCSTSSPTHTNHVFIHVLR